MGLGYIKTQILRALENDMRRVLEGSDHNLETLKACDSRKAQSYCGPGVYVLVIYIPSDPEGVRVYVGSAVYVSTRIQRHIRTRRNPKWRSKTAHYRFWNKPGTRDLWILMGGFKDVDFEDQECKPMLLNIFEMYGMLLFRTLNWQTLQAYLPKKASAKPYPWMGLNEANPLSQWRDGLNEQSLSKPGRRHKTIKGKYFWRNYHCWSTNTRSIFRPADPSQRDKKEAKVMCNVCRNSQSYFLDKKPKYEVKSGKYVIKRYPCHHCQGMEASFIPVNPSIPSRNYESIMARLVYERAKQGDAVARAKIDALNASERVRRRELKAIVELGDRLAQAQYAQLLARGNGLG